MENRHSLCIFYSLVIIVWSSAQTQYVFRCWCNSCASSTALEALLSGISFNSRLGSLPALVSPTQHQVKSEEVCFLGSLSINSFVMSLSMNTPGPLDLPVVIRSSFLATKCTWPARKKQGFFQSARAWLTMRLTCSFSWKNEHLRISLLLLFMQTCALSLLLLWWPFCFWYDFSHTTAE